MDKRLNDAVIQARIDRRYLATGTVWMESQGMSPRSVVDVFRTIFEAGIRGLVEQNQVRFMTSTADAMKYLERRFGVKLNPNGRALKNLTINLQKENNKITPDYSGSDKVEKIDKNAVERLVQVGLKDAKKKLEKKQKEMEEGLDFIPEKGGDQ